MVDSGTRPIEDESIDIRRYLGIVINYWWLVLLLPIAGGAIGYYTSSSQPDVYETSATLLVQHRRAAFSAGISDFDLSSQLAVTYAQRVTAGPFLKRVLEKYELPLTIGQLRGVPSSGPATIPRPCGYEFGTATLNSRRA